MFIILCCERFRLDQLTLDCNSQRRNIHNSIFQFVRLRRKSTNVIFRDTCIFEQRNQSICKSCNLEINLCFLFHITSSYFTSFVFLSCCIKNLKTWLLLTYHASFQLQINPPPPSEKQSENNEFIDYQNSCSYSASSQTRRGHR